MRYDPIKKSLGKVFNKTPFLRIVFYRLLDLLLLRTWYIKRELRSWKKNAPKDAKILDAGSGFGQYVWRLSQFGSKYQILGVDVKQEQIDDCNDFFARKKLSNRVNFQVADLVKFSDENRYDLVLSVDVMEHIKEDVKVMQNLYNSLKKGGMLLISTPSDKGGSDTDDHGDEVTGFIAEHVRDGYSIEDIEEKLRSVGFTKIESRYSYGVAGNIAWRLSMKCPIMTLNKSKLFFILLPFYYIIAYPLAFILNVIDMLGNHKKGTGLIVKAIKE